MAKAKAPKVALTKTDIINAIAKKENITKNEAKQCLATVLDALVECAKELKNDGDNLKIVEFITLTLKHSKAREGRNPRTKEAITIPAKDRFTIKTGKKFNELLNK